MIIYKATNLINGKIYIGKSTKSLKTRKKEHLSFAKKGIKRHFYNAIRKYGESNFKWEILTETDSEFELNEMEKYCIAIYSRIAILYNTTKGGNGGDTFSGLTEEQKIKTNEKRSASLKGKCKGRKLSQEQIELLRKVNTGKVSSMRGRTYEEIHGKEKAAELKEILSKHMKNKVSHMKGKHHTNKTKEKISERKKGASPAWNKGKAWNDITRKKLSDSHMGQIAWNKGLTKDTDERIRKSAINQIGRITTQEVKDKISKTLTGRPGKKHTEETKKKISERKKGHTVSEETCKKISISRKAINKPAWNKGKQLEELIGKERADELKRGISERLKGNIPWNKGIPQTEAVKNKLSIAVKENAKNNPNFGMKGKKHNNYSIEKMRESHKGFIPPNKGKKGLQVAWNKGKTWDELYGKERADELRKKNGDAHHNKSAWNKGKKLTVEHKLNLRKGHAKRKEQLQQMKVAI